MTTELREHLRRIVHEEQERKRLQVVAKGLSTDPDFYVADWGKFSDRPTFSLWQLTALSVGINPRHACAKPEPAEYVTKFVSGNAKERLLEMLKRLKIAVLHLDLSKYGLPIEQKVGERSDYVVLTADFVDFAKSKNWHLPAGMRGIGGGAQPAEHGWSDGSIGTGETVDTEELNPRAHPLQRGLFQEQEILRVIRKLSYDPQSFPRNRAGKPGAKAEVRANLNFTKKVFNLAWERLRKKKDIVDAT